MTSMHRSLRRLSIAFAAGTTISASSAIAQDADPLPVNKDTLFRFPNTIAGEFTPGTGFNVISTKFGSLNISAYGLFRYLNQLPAGQTFTDHLGQVRQSNLQNSFNWQRTIFWFTGFFYDPRFRYNITSWSLGATQQTLLFGNLQFIASKNFVIGVGITPTLTARSMQGSWPFWVGSDRLMVEEFFRGGFSSGMFVTGEIVPRLFYTLSINNNLSQLGQVQANDSRDLAYSGALRWQPTTGEFGPRGGFGDFEYHTRVATQLGMSGGSSREFRGTPVDQSPVASQIKLSDGTNPFDFGSLARGVTVSNLSYHELAIDAGVKYRGFALQGEYYFRTLNDFNADGPLPLSSIYDHGFMAEAGYMVIPKRLNLDAFGGYVSDQFRRFPWEAGGGLNFYPSGTRSWRLNLHVMHVDKSPASSTFGYYLAGQTGTTFSIGTDVLF
jgi:hypothetical protein